MPNHHDSRHGLPANSHLHERNRSPFEGQHVQNQTFVWFEIYCCKINRFSRWTALFWEQKNLNQMHGVESWTSECVNTYNISSKWHGGKQNSVECWEQKLGFGLTWSSTQFQNISNYHGHCMFWKETQQIEPGMFFFSSLPAWLRPSTSKHFATSPTNFELDSSRAYDLDDAIFNGPARE